MLALVVAAREGSRIFRGRAAVRWVFCSTVLAVSLTFARFGCVISIASVAFGQGTAIIKELTFLQLPNMEQALLNKNGSITRGPHSKEDRPMHFTKLKCLKTQGNTKDCYS